MNTATNVAVYDVGTFGDEEPRQILPIGNEPPSSSSLDVYILNPTRVSQIHLPDSPSGFIVKTICFNSTFSPQPCII